ncbi:DUF1330 domain-containing protein [Aquimarina sp. RZ0]|uniref:DUF1330 domain-containing protein n=1 Tax=Aquimarina sp. RZ0 TaxID=2607730 RepID=UPI0011F1CD32|nr:DUF1330 domain-containing protein [Aquimarina sp. RZ0]KAA1248124.1 DUF1330 domain-containing protein [Aquimarina sp. RZ0]
MLLKNSKNILVLALVFFLQISCTTENNFNEKSENLTHTKAYKNNTDPLKRRYHFIRFNINNEVKYDAYINALKNLVSAKGGKILTLGIPEECLERTCKDINIVIEFPNEKLGEMFFESYQKLKYLACRATSDLAYHSGASFQIPGVFDDSIDRAHYLIVNLNHLDLPRYLEEFARPTVGLIVKNGGILLSDDFRTQQCLQGDCLQYSVL